MDVDIFDFLSPQALDAHIEMARLEDLGPTHLDATSEMLLPREASGRSTLVSRAEGMVCGLSMLPAISQAFGGLVDVKLLAKDGDNIHKGSELASFDGPLRPMLAMERTTLNYLTHLSGISSLTARFVKTVEGTTAQICDTRKTIPGMRALAKYAVACGGGTTHRMGLHDAILVKDNHIAHLSPDELTEFLNHRSAEARKRLKHLKFFMVEVDNLHQLDATLKAQGVDLVLLDNMHPSTLQQAVEMRDKIAPKIVLEASGGVTLETVRVIAASGVDRISIGQLTHSAPQIDIGLDR